MAETAARCFYQFKRITRQFTHRLLYFEGACVGRQWGAEVHADLIAQFGDWAQLCCAVVKAGQAAPSAADVDGDDRVVAAFDNTFKAWFEGAHHASSAN